MKISKILFIIIFCISIIYSDENAKTSDSKLKSSIYFNFLGQSPIFSLNIDKHIIHDKLTIGTGVGVNPFFYTFLSIPVNLNLLFGNLHFLEIGIGVTDFIEIKLNNEVDSNFDSILIAPNFSIGYRYQPKKGVLFKVCLVTFINNENETLILPGIGIGLMF